MRKTLQVLLLLLGCSFTIAININAQQRAVHKEFLDAVEQRDLPRVAAALASGANVDAKEPINGHFALQYAIDWPDEIW